MSWSDKDDSTTCSQLRPLIAVYFGGIGDLSGGGGAERYFADLLSKYTKQPTRKYDLSIISDNRSLERLSEVGCNIETDNVVLLPAKGRIGGMLAYGFRARDACGARKVALHYVPLVNPRYLLALAFLKRRGRGPRAGIALNALDCTLPDLRKEPLLSGKWMTRAYFLYGLYFSLIKPDSVFTPYLNLCQSASDFGLRSDSMHRMDAFVIDSERYAPAAEKANVVVWAGRLDWQKRPLMFVEAISRLKANAPGLLDGWAFEMYGRGPLQDEVATAIRQSGLSGLLRLSSSARMDRVLARSKVFVSTQEFENFSSMAMLEAMVSANAIVAFPVGMTGRWVQPGYNGLLSATESTADLADALAALLRDPDKTAAMGAAARTRALEENTLAKALGELERFFDASIAASPSNK